MDLNPGELAGAPSTGLGFSLLTKSYEAIKNVKVYKRRCESVARHCESLLVALQESVEGLEGERPAAIADEMAGIVRHIEGKVTQWAGYNYLKSFLLQGDIQEGLLEIDRHIQSVGLKFSVKMVMDTARFNLETRNVQKNDQMELRDLLARIVKDMEDIKRLVVLESPSNPIVEEVMASLQTELMAPDLQPAHEETFKRGLWMLHQKTRKLPPLTNLSGQVEKTTKHRIAAGTHNDIYIGLWLNKEEVALRSPRLLPGSRGVQQRFERDLTIWRKLDHPNIVPLYGIFYEGSDIYSVSPWMKNGTVLDYITRHADIDRLQLIYQAATGLEYLHENDIIHGDMRAGNILIDGDGVARLSDFGMSKMLEDVGRGATTLPGLNPRWYAPELLEPNTSLSKETDVWSFAMACLEILTGQPPFAVIKNDMAVYQQLMKGKHPQRPAQVTDPVWSLLKKCWEKKPKSRPPISEVRKQIDAIRRTPSKPRSQTTSQIAGIGRRASDIGFRKPNKKRDSVSSATSSGTGSVQSRPILSSGYVEEPENITPSTSYSSSTLPQELLKVELPHEEDWKIKFELVDGAVPGDYLDKPLTPISESSASTTAPSSRVLEPKRVLTSDSSSRFSSTQAVITDASIVINLHRDGSVSSGTLEGLMERMITGFSRRQDKEFWDILLSSTVDFISAEEFFSVIERRFYEAEHAIVRHPEDRIARQYNILEILSYWVSTPHLPLGPQLIWQIRNFCDNAKAKVSSSMMREKVEKVTQSLDQDIRSASLPLPAQGPAMRASDMLPSDLAIGLTLLESDKLQQIFPSDYLLHVGGHPVPNAVEAAKRINDKIVKWVQKSMLHFDNVLRRTEVMTFFLNAAKECLQLRNFASAVAIATALNSPAISALDYTRDQLERPQKLILRELTELISENRDYLNYRTALSNMTTDSDECIPWLAVHLNDLVLILDRYPPTLDSDDDHILINFERYTQFRTRLQESILSFSGAYPRLQRYRHQGQLAYVESKLENIVLDDESVDVELIEQAKQMKIKEMISKRNRDAEKERIGLRQPKKKKN